MDVISPHKSLNEAQRKVVTSDKKNILVLAGAGSGKTHVLTQRVTWLVKEMQIPLSQIMAVTFTNKAAKEMRQRLEKVLSTSIHRHGMWLGTFHGLCFRFLRAHYETIGLPADFQILDTTDQKRCLKNLLKENKWDQSLDYRYAARFIEQQKNQGVRAQNIEPNHLDFPQRKLLPVYIAYEKYCKQCGLVDFSELLLSAVETLRDHEDIRVSYHNKIRAILIDEFQDTNKLQYAWLQHLTGPHTMTFAVGDDDQSIYGWRGAQSANMQKFLNDFSGAETYRLEQNYRSTQTILSAANGLISNNERRMGKKLWSEGVPGKAIIIFPALNEREEARFVVKQILHLLEEGEIGNEIAILYRSNAQSRVLEEELIQNRLAYTIYGGMRFFERAVVKDVLAYLKVTRNPADDVSFERIINMPPRGIGLRTLEPIRQLAQKEACSLWQALLKVREQNIFGKKVQNTIDELLAWIEQYDWEKMKLSECIEKVIEHSTLRAYHKQSKSERAQSSLENMQELVIAANEFDNEMEQNGPLNPDLGVLDNFLAHVTLDAGEREAGDADYPIQLMTVHSAKGLEFNCVFIIGLEEGLFPHVRSMEEGNVDEERRLCYVGITRAKKRLIISYAQSRYQYAGQYYTRNTVSRFLGELPPELLEEVK
ncbi:MAG: 3'-5' exonuclease [Candidatus Oxydemutatoraceae bacterium WSBS_2016_MAG_OTU14]